MAYEVELRDIQSQPTIALREEVARDQIRSMLTERVVQIDAFVSDNFGRRSGRPYARLHNYGEVERTDVDVEVGVPVAQAIDVPGDASFLAGALPGGKVAVLRYDGPYENIGRAYEQLQDWVRRSDYEGEGAPWEQYLSDLESDAWDVELVWPLLGS